MDPTPDSRRILCVSHDPAVRNSIGGALAQAGFAIGEAEGGVQALLELDKELPDLVLVDVDRAGMDSNRLCTQIRLQPRSAHLPVLFLLSGRVADNGKAQALNNGADGYLNWPENRDLLVASVKSVLRRRQTEARLRKREERFRATFEHAAVGLGHLNLNGEWTCANRRLCQILGYTQEELLQRNCLDLAGPEGQQTLLEQTRRVVAGEAESFALEERCRRKDGSVFWVSCSVSAGRHPSGEAEYLVAVVDDISVRKWTEENLLLIRAGIEGSSEAIAITDVGGRHSYRNRAFARMFGYGAEELTEPLAQVALYADQAVGRAVFEAIMHGRAWRGEADMVAKDGRHFLVELRADAIRDEQGQLIGLIGVHTDITERRQLEAHLRHAQKMEAVGQLAGGIAHDFNNMLAVIRGNADLLLMEGEPQKPESAECINHLIAASERAANLTRQLLIFSRKQVMQSQALAVNDLVKNLAKMLKRTIREDILMEYAYADPLPLVQADPGMLEQVLLNLVVNARDAMPGGGRIRIATETAALDEESIRGKHEAKPGSFVCLSVTDNGTGIAPENLTRIFDPFFTTKEPGKGTGLGLATVYGIVQQHRGWVEVSSQVGTGTTFKVLLPALPRSVSPEAAPQTEEKLLKGTETILLVEDDYSVRFITRRMLESAGFRVCEASSSREALEIWDRQEGEIALLLSDIVMPDGISGRELAEKLRAQKPELRVIFMSGYSAEVIGKDTGFFRQTNSRFLHKPCTASSLVRTVRESLDGK